MAPKTAKKRDIIKHVKAAKKAKPAKKATAASKSLPALKGEYKKLFPKSASKKVPSKMSPEDKRDIMLAHDAIAEIERDGAVPWEEVKARLGL